MNDSRDNRRTVKLDDVRQNNIVWTDLNESLMDSVFEQHFKKAVQTIGDIINETKKSESKSWKSPCGENKNRDCRSCRHRDFYGCEASSNPPDNWTKFHTAVPFIGERGTGKTSVMFSVLEYLKRYRGEAASGLDSFKDVRFITFDMIDAAMLTSTEDVMEIILSRMLSYLEEFSGESDFRDLYRQIDELHKNMNRVYGNKPDSRDGYGLSSLQQIADGQKVKTDFSKLVSDFRKVISNHKFSNTDCFLVVALDDVDLYQGAKSGLHDSQYALLEHIYNYMRIPGLVVLMTYNEYILRRECSRHFAHIYFGDDKPKEREYTPSEREDIDNLTAQFMSKLFPQERRIYLPNYLFVNTNNEADLYVKPVLVGKEGAVALVPFSVNQKLSVKEFMLRLIAHRTGVYFDAAGTKQHFFESRNLREFGELFQIVNSMEDTGKFDSTKSDIIKAENCQKLLEYFYDQYALKHLETEEYRQFQQVSIIPVARQKVWLIDQIHKQLEATILDKKRFDESNLDKKRFDESNLDKKRLEEVISIHGQRWSYSYGELLRCIYFATRYEKVGESSGATIYSKEFIHCILGTHSVIMNRLGRQNDQEVIRKIIGSSVAGKWANQMLPPAIDTNKRSPYAIAAGSISNLPITRYFDWKLPKIVLNAIWDYDSQAYVLKDYLEALLLVGMFFTGAPEELRIKWEPDFDDGENVDVFMRSDSREHVCFNVLNFVINLYNKDSYFSNMREKLKKLGTTFAEEFICNWMQKHESIMIRVEKLRTEIKKVRERSKLYEPVLEDLDRECDNLNRKMDVLTFWGQQVSKNEFESEGFTSVWEKLVDDLIDDFDIRGKDWQSVYGKDHLAVLPIEHFDMMYNVLKRLANDSYYDKPEQIPLEELYDYCVKLYANILEELEKQDAIYGEDFVNAKKTKFSDAFRNCIFYESYAGNAKNPFIKDMHHQMMRSALKALAARSSSGAIGNTSQFDYLFRPDDFV